MRRRLWDEAGQTLVLVQICLVALIGMAGLVLDIGQLHGVHGELQIAADAAALAGAQDLPGTSAITTACSYGASLSGDLCNGSAMTSNGENSSPSLSNVTTTVTPECISTASAGISCITGTECPAGQYFPPDGTANNVAGCNAIEVTEVTHSAPLLRGALGLGATTVSASATASMAGGFSKPVDTEVIIDSTASMGDSDTCGGSSGVSSIPDPTAEDCAKDGIRALLGVLDPCSNLLTSCGSVSDDNVANPVNSVGLMTFPALNGNVSTGTGTGIPDDTDCTQELSNADTTYTLNPNYYSNNGVQYSNYQIVPLSSDYRTSDSATALNTSSNLVSAVDWGDCPGGGYPDNSSTTSIAGGGSGDITTAGSQLIAGGANTTSDVSTASNTTGISGGASVAGDSSTATNAITGGASVSGDSSSVVNTSSSGIGGGIGGGDVAYGQTTGTSSSSVVVGAPPGASTTGSFELVSVTTTALASGAVICAPSGFTQLSASGAPGVVTQGSTTETTQATFYSVAPPTSSSTFSFKATSCTGSASTATSASAVAIVYTGVNLSSPLDGVTPTDTSATASSLTGKTITPTSNNDEIVTLFGTTSAFETTVPTASIAATATPTPPTYTTASTAWGTSTEYVALTSTCVSTTAATCATKPAAGTLNSVKFTFGSTLGSNESYTVTLYKDAASTGSTCSIATNASSCTIGGLSLALNGTDTAELAITRSGTASVTTTGTTSPTELTDEVSTGADEVSDPTGGAATTGMPSAGSSSSSNYMTTVTVALDPALPSSITVTPPSGYATGDFMLVSIGVQELGSGVICPPASAPTWNVASAAVTEGTGGNALTQESFWTTTSTASSDAFSFETSCSSGTAVQAAASAVALNYVGVNTTTPLDGVTAVTAKGTASPLTLGTIKANSADDDIVSLFATNATTLTVTNGVVSSGWTDSGASNLGQETSGVAVTPGGATSSPTTANWTAVALALKPAVSTSITITPPSGYAPGDLELVTITTQGLPSGDVVCAPTSGGTWTTAAATTTDGSGASLLTQTTFWTETSTVGTDTFNFETACSGGTAVSAGASALALTYTGISASPIDTSSSTATTTAAGTTLTAPLVSTSAPNDVVISLFSTDATSLTLSGTGASQVGFWSSVGAQDTQQPASGSSGTSAVTATTATSSNWIGTTIALKASVSSSVTLTAPSGYTAGDVMLVSVAVRGLGTNVICAPDATWTSIATVSSGTGTSMVTQETFWTSTSSTTSDSFSFASSCSGGTAVSAGATALALSYTGVDTTSPIDSATPSGSAYGTASASSAGTSLSAPSVTTASASDEVVNMYATGASSISGVNANAIQSGLWTTSGAEDTYQVAAGSSGAGAATGGASAYWTGETIALRRASTSSLTIARPANPTTSDFLLVTVTASGLGSNLICAPNDGTWTQVGSQVNSGSGTTEISQASFYSFRTTASAETYQFSFLNASSCSASGTAASPVSSSAIAIRYTGVNPLSPIDTSATGSGSGTTLTAPSVASSDSVGDEVVSLYGTGATSFSSGLPAGQSVAGTAEATGFEASIDTSAGGGSAQTAYTSATHTWATETIAIAASDPGCYNTCFYGVEDPGGVGTYYGGVISEAQTALATYGSSSSQKAIILLSDGDATSTSSQLSGSGYSATGECQAGIDAAEQAEAAGMWVITVAYNSETSNSCTTDTDPSMSALCAMHLMADNPVDDSSLSGDTLAQAEAVVCANNATDTAHHFYNQPSDTSLETLFQGIGDSLSSPRLISNSAS